MTTARWWSVVCGCLALFANWSSEGNPPNVWDFFVVLAFQGSAVALVVVPLVLEYLERRNR